MEYCRLPLLLIYLKFCPKNGVGIEVTSISICYLQNGATNRTSVLKFLFLLRRETKFSSQLK